MAMSSRATTTELQIPKKWKDERESSPERTKVWTEPSKTKNNVRKVPVLYYLSRNGQLDHPHFMEVPLSSPHGLYLRDVINRLNLLRGKGMASMYSWSSKRSYKSGFVWHDLAENDFIYPAHGQEYVLKGSELLFDVSSNAKSHEIVASSSSKHSPENLSQKSGDDSDFPVVVTRRRNQSWSSIDLHEYKVYKTESAGNNAAKFAADASTQTDERRRRRRTAIREEPHEEKTPEPDRNQSVELSREEISPPPSDSSPETLEALMKADGRLVLCANGGNEDNLNRTAMNGQSGRMKASTVLMQLISCGSMSFKDCGPTSVKDQGFSLISHYKARLPRGAGKQVGKEGESLIEKSGSSSFRGVKLEDKEYFSGSLIETRKDEFPTLKRSSSYNADRRSELDLAKTEIGETRSKCIPRKLKALPSAN